MSNPLRSLRVGYVPYSKDLNSPGDRRRFLRYSSIRNIDFKLASPSEKYDVVVVVENADISVWSQYDRGSGKVVYDFIDSYLAIPRRHLKGELRGIAKYVSRQHRHLRVDHWRALQAMCARADAVICATAEQGRDIGPYCPNVHQILDIHAWAARSGKSEYGAGKVFNLVWEGLPENVGSLRGLRRVLAELEGRHEIALHLVTDLQFKAHLGLYGATRTADIARGLCKRTYLYEWNEQMAAAIMCASDLAVIPINLDDAMAAGKPENKLVLFWRLGVPAVTSATPAYERAMAAAGVAATCRDESEWLVTLERFISDENLRRQAGSAGKALADSRYSEQQILGQWDRLFESIL